MTVDLRRLKTALGYRRFAGPGRLLILDTGYLMVNDVIQASRELGWHTVALPTRCRGNGAGEFVGRLLTALLDHRPDFVLTLNHLGFDEQGVLSQLLDRLDVPTASWFVDHPLPIVGGTPDNATSGCQVFCFERTALPWLAEQGYSDPQYLPTATPFDPGRAQPELVRRLAWPLTFAGNSWWIKARKEPPGWARRGAAALRRIHNITRHEITRGLEQSLSKVPLPVKHSRARYAVAATAMAEASMARRGQLARALAPHGLRVHGDPAWRQLAPGVDLKPGVKYQDQLPALFAGSQVNANVTAEQMPTAINQRVWDVPGVGGFLLTDDQEDALTFFEEDREVVVYRDFEEAADKARYYLDHPTQRQAIADRARRKVARNHRLTHRLQQMAEVMAARFG